ncbi:MAG: hypothetical protein PSV22_14395 [Pseudolabrys sp.]|nr:hypothetical protein [Pseudolabrys sp.]
MALAAVIGAACCCTDNPCDCGTTSFAIAWTGHIRLASDCSVCEAFDPENYDPSAYLVGDISTPSTMIVEQDVSTEPACRYDLFVDINGRVTRCDGSSTEALVGMWVFVEFGKGGIDGIWRVTIRVYRVLNGSDVPPYGQIFVGTWIAAMPGGDGACPPLGTYAWDSGTEPSTESLCWSPSGAIPIAEYARGTLTVS